MRQKLSFSIFAQQIPRDQFNHTYRDTRKHIPTMRSMENFNFSCRAPSDASSLGNNNSNKIVNILIRSAQSKGNNGYHNTNNIKKSKWPTSLSRWWLHHFWTRSQAAAPPRPPACLVPRPAQPCSPACDPVDLIRRPAALDLCFWGPPSSLAPGKSQAGQRLWCCRHCRPQPTPTPFHLISLEEASPA